MNTKDFVRRWESVAVAAEQACEETGESVPLAIVTARFGGYEEVQLEIPRRALLDVRKDVKSMGGSFRAILI